MADLKKVLNAVAVPLVVVTADLSVRQANRAAAKTLAGLKARKSLARAGFSKKRLKALLESARRDGQARARLTTSETFVREFQVQALVAEWRSPDAEPAFLLTFEDRSALRDARSMRSDFVANVSHEIRSPLTAISGFVETLQGEAADDPEAREMFLGLMAREADRMTNLVGDLLSLSQVEVKERRAPRKRADLGQALEQALAAARRLAARRGKTVLDEIADLPPILGKQDDLARVFINLLENAVNYSRDGAEIRLTAGLAAAENPLRKPAIIVAVADQGEGIAAQEIPRLTERFYRVDKSRSRNLGGTGLGLAIVKHILMRHRGRLVIESTPGEGSVFTVFLPVEGNRHKA